MTREDAVRLAEELARECVGAVPDFPRLLAVEGERAAVARIARYTLRALEQASLVKPSRIEAAERAVVDAALDLQQRIPESLSQHPLSEAVDRLRDLRATLGTDGGA